MQIQKAESLGLLSPLRKNQGLLSKVLERLSTAQAINRASDDAAGLSISEEMRTQVRGFQMANVNIDYAQAAQNIAEGTAGEVTDMLQRQRELAVQAGNDTLTGDQRAALNQEYQQLNQEITRISQASQFNTQGVAAGTGLGAGGGEVLAGPNPGAELPIQGANFTAANLGTEGSNILTRANAENAISTVDTALNNLNQQRTSIGANINRMEHAYTSNENAAANTQEAESRIRDQDYAQGVMEMTQRLLLNQTATASLRNFNSINKNNMMFLMGQ
jgi:flagellin